MNLIDVKDRRKGIRKETYSYNHKWHGLSRARTNYALCRSSSIKHDTTR